VTDSRWRVRALPFAVVVVALLLAGILAPMPATRVSSPPPGADASRAPAAPVTDHVVIVSIDGLRPDAIEPFGASTLLRLMREGSFALRAETIVPSHTIPTHTSMVTGVEAAVHGVTWNDRASVLSALVTWSDRRRQVPTMFDFVHAAGLRGAAFVGKSQMAQLETPGSLDHVAAPFFPFAHIKRQWRAPRVIAELESYLLDGGAAPNLLFVHLSEPDRAGHASGWMSDEYAGAVREADAALDRILALADAAFGVDGYTIIVTSDHGGVGRSHGEPHPLNLAIPWITAGRGVAAGGTIEQPVRVLDTAATALWLLGLPVPPEWSGRPVEAAYRTPAGSDERGGQ